MNEYQIRTTFLDEDEYPIIAILFTPQAESSEEAYDIIRDEIENNPELYPSEDYEFKLMDVC